MSGAIKTELFGVNAVYAARNFVIELRFPLYILGGRATARDAAY